MESEKGKPGRNLPSVNSSSELGLLVLTNPHIYNSKDHNLCKNMHLALVHLMVRRDHISCCLPQITLK